MRQLLHDRIRDAYIHPQFVADVMKPLLIESIIDQEVRTSVEWRYIKGRSLWCESICLLSQSSATLKDKRGYPHNIFLFLHKNVCFEYSLLYICFCREIRKIFFSWKKCLIWSFALTLNYCRLLCHLFVILKVIFANSVDPDQTAPLGAVWSGSTLFACMQK